LVFIFGGLAALGIAGFLTLSNWRIYRDRQTIQANIDKLHEQLQILEEQHQVLQAGIDAAQSGDSKKKNFAIKDIKNPAKKLLLFCPIKLLIIVQIITLRLIATTFGRNYGLN